MHFLWTNINGGITFDFPSANSIRVHSHIEYTDNDSEFYNEMIKLSKIAEKEVKKYREFKDPFYAKKQLLHKSFPAEQLWGYWNKAMLCFLCDDFRNGKHYIEVFSKNNCKHSETINQFIKEQTGIFSAKACSADDLKNIILFAIKEQRQSHRNHGMKDLKIHMLYG